MATMDDFCGSPFWVVSLSWRTNDTSPDLPICFQQTVVAWLPIIFIWITAPKEFVMLRSQPRLHFVTNTPWTWFGLGRTIISGAVFVVSLFEFLFMMIQLDTGQPLPLVYVVTPFVKAIAVLLVFLLMMASKKIGRRNSGGPVWLFWFFTFVSGCFTYQTILRSSDTGYLFTYGPKIFSSNSAVLAMFVICLTTQFYLVIANVVLFSFADPPPIRVEETVIKDRLSMRRPDKVASFPSQLLFSWVTPLMYRALNESLEIDDLPTTDNELLCENAFQELNRRFIQKEPGKPIARSKRNVVGALWRTFNIEILQGLLMSAVNDLLQFARIAIFQAMINLQNTTTTGSQFEKQWKFVFYGAISFILVSGQAIGSSYYIYHMQSIAIRVHTALMSAVYRKALVLASTSKTSSGELINLMVEDSSRHKELVMIGNAVVSAVIKISLNIVYLYTIIQWSLFAPIVFTILLTPINFWIITVVTKHQMAMAKLRDDRFQIMNELVGGMRVLKLYGWELGFRDIIQMIRVKEVKMIRKVQSAMALLIIQWRLAPVFMTMAAFYCYVLVNDNKGMDSDIAFIGSQIIAELGMSIAMVPQIFTTIYQSRISVRRMNAYLNSDEIDPYVIRIVETGSADRNATTLLVENGTFAWTRSLGKGEKQFVLRDINIAVKRGQLLAVVGAVGSGKSTLLNAIMGNLTKLSGRVSVCGKIAYVPQQAWIYNVSLRDNILFTKPFDKEKYGKILKASALLPDMKVLPAGDLTEIGEKGINLSGGQKQRISIARACYAEADVYLFDDPLSAVDAHVGAHLFEQVLGHSGILADRTRVLVTHSVSFLPFVDHIVMLKEGRIIEQGTFIQLVKTNGAFSELVRQLEGQQDKEGAAGPSKETADFEGISALGANVSKRAAQLTQAEDVKVGAVEWHVYFGYLSAIGCLWPTAILFFSVLSAVLSFVSLIWLHYWARDLPGPDGKVNVPLRNNRMMVYGLLGIANAAALLLCSVGRNYASIKAAVTFHTKVLYSVLRSPVSFFETTPLGRIVNRFAKDITIVDLMVADTLHMWAFAIIQLLVAIFMIGGHIPMFITSAVPLAALYYGFQLLYIALSRQLQRLTSISFSPIFSHFTESFSGISIIRAFEVEKAFVKESCKRLDESVRCTYASLAAERWLSVRMEVCGSLVVLFACLVMVYYGEKILSAENVGMIFSFAMRVTATLNGIVRSNSQIETAFVSVERLIEYMNLPSEAEWSIRGQKPPEEWPTKGKVVFKNYSTRYRNGLPLVLKNISATIRAGEKVGIVGRTGAGKSSLTLALFRVLEPASGKIIIDGIDIRDIGLHDLRHRLTIIPQDSVLFRGSLRLNLDPLRMDNGFR
ncbi:multidrug resistance-associated protein 1-like isoform X4 [Varroa destructor]|uniref:Uncharacterized protein n=1 Tax=Varroa destructor TaxID=109461 RepID=A0A7M7MJ97_VARDE|nr:multidrug resistance-associated protein 1-like isoform X4 [Varroa destructor]